MDAYDINDFQFIKNEILLTEINPWDKMILLYLSYLGYQNFQLAYQSYQIIHKTNDISFIQQFFFYFLLMYSLNNINISYKYFLYKTYTINPEVARKLYQKFNKYFHYFQDQNDIPDVSIHTDVNIETDIQSLETNHIFENDILEME